MTLHNHVMRDQSIFRQVLDRINCGWQNLKVRRAVTRERALLRTLDDRALKDIGVTRVEAQFEASRRSWDIPADRLATTRGGSGCMTTGGQLVHR